MPWRSLETQPPNRVDMVIWHHLELLYPTKMAGTGELPCVSGHPNGPRTSVPMAQSHTGNPTWLAAANSSPPAREMGRARRSEETGKSPRRGWREMSPLWTQSDATKLLVARRPTNGARSGIGTNRNEGPRRRHSSRMSRGWLRKAEEIPTVLMAGSPNLCSGHSLHAVENSGDMPRLHCIPQSIPKPPQCPIWSVWGLFD